MPDAGIATTLYSQQRSTLLWVPMYLLNRNNWNPKSNLLHQECDLNHYLFPYAEVERNVFDTGLDHIYQSF